MNSMEFNKLAAGLLSAALVFLLLNFFAGLIYGTRDAAHVADGEHGPVLAYALPVEDAGGAGAAEEEQIDLHAVFAAADPAAGEGAFRACGACHALEPGVNKVGPSLNDAVGRDIAAVEGFAYSDPMAAMEGDWTPERLFHFLADPRGYVPGTKMSFAGIADPQANANVIAYLNQSGGSPVDLTEGLEPLAPAADEAAGAEGQTQAAAGEAPSTDAGAAGAEAQAGGAPVATTESATETTASSTVGQPGVGEVVGVGTVDVGDEGVEVGSTTPPQIVQEAPSQPGAGTGSGEVPAEPTGTVPVGDAGAQQQPAEGAGAQQQPAQGAGAQQQPAQGATTPQQPAEGAGFQQQPAQGTEAQQQPAAPAQTGEAAAPADAMLAGDAAAGEGLFRRCQACHTLEQGQNRVGPHLVGVVGRDIAAVEDFNYSNAMAALDGVWTPEALSAYLADPKGVVPGTKMAFAGLKDEQDRIDLITFLQGATQ